MGCSSSKPVAPFAPAGAQQAAARCARR